MNCVDTIKKVSELLTIKQELTVEDYLIKQLKKDFAGRKIAIYGAGNIGKKIYKLLVQAKCTVVCFFDRGALAEQKLGGIPVYRADDENLGVDFKKNLLVVLALLTDKQERKSIERFLQKNGYENIDDRYSLLGTSLPFYSERCIDFSAESKKIYRVLELMADNHSRDIFYSSLKAHITYNYDDTIISDNMIEYFKVEVPFNKGYANFIDCGAFTGDSLKDLLQYHDCHTYIAFEPDLNNFKSLVKYVKQEEQKIKQAFLYPCAVAEKCCYSSFDGGKGYSGMLKEHDGTEMVQVVALDDVLRNVIPTMIKMDIEGAEIQALHGAKKIIVAEEPDLAICVYHRVTDLWEIPILLHEWVPSYKFYLRCHYEATIGTVLYATVK